VHEIDVCAVAAPGTPALGKEPDRKGSAMRIDETGPETLDSADAADVAEQRAELEDDSFDADTRDDLPLEADPADVAEQERAVPYDDER
jgi:hypothetical protein